MQNFKFTLKKALCRGLKFTEFRHCSADLGFFPLDTAHRPAHLKSDATCILGTITLLTTVMAKESSSCGSDSLKASGFSRFKW